MKGIIGLLCLRATWWTPRLARLRYLVYATGFEVAGRRGSIGRGVRFLGRAKIEIADHVTIRARCTFGGNGRFRIGAGTVINEECILTAMEQVEIGRDVMLAPRVYVLDVDHAFVRRDIPISKQGYDVAPVRIGDGVWIGTGTVITRGVQIGEGAIIGANSVVTSDIPPYVIAAGCPARVLRERPA